MDQAMTEPMIVQLVPGVVFERRDIGGRSTYVAQHQESGKYFHFGAEEYRVATLLNGQRTLADVGAQLQIDGIDWTVTEIADFVGKLVASKLATMQLASSPKPARMVVGWSARIARVLSLLVSQRIPLINGHRLATALEARIGLVFARPAIACWVLLVGSAMLVVALHRQQFAAELKRLFDPGEWFILFVMWVVVKMIHELGHAVAARYHGVQVGKLGILFFLCAPLAYVDVTDAWKLRSRSARIQIALAGIYLELAVAAIAAWAWWWLPAGYAKHLSAQLFLIAGPATLLINANPLLRLDGYYFVSDLTEIPNLRMHGRGQLAGLCNHALLGVEPPASLLSGWRRPFATAHAMASVIFQAVWMTGLVLGVAVWFRGLGIVLAVAAVSLWVVLPLLRWSAKSWQLQPAGRFYLNDLRIRILCLVSLAAMTIQNLSVNASPLARRVPVVVQFRGEQIARAAVDAFVSGVHVQRGQRVTAGMLLVELNDPELIQRRAKKADELQLAELRAVQLRRQHELAKSAAETENAASLARQLAELDAQIEALNVVAQRDGLVISPEIDSLHGRFVKRGEELLRVSDPQEKELLVAVGEDDLLAYAQASAAARPASIRLRGGTKLAAVPAPLRPRARRRLPHPALAATVGGPLAVEPADQQDQSVRLVSPQMESRTPLDPATSALVRAGQVGTMTIADNRSLLDRLYDAMKR